MRIQNGVEITEVQSLEINESYKKLIGTAKPFEAFSTRFKISIWAAIVACSPVILWQLLAFFLPALKPNERKWVVPTVAAMAAHLVFCLLGCLFLLLSKSVEAFLYAQKNG